MCGIFGVLSKEGEDTVPIVLRGLKKLEYRGYDSSGFWTCGGDGTLKMLRAVGPVEALEKQYRLHPVAGNPTVGHTRWATHGKVCLANTHPIAYKDCAVVLNGVVENSAEIMKKYAAGTAVSETDVECIVHYLLFYRDRGLEVEDILTKMLREVKGDYSFLATIFDHRKIWGLKNGNPLIVGAGEKHTVVASDILAGIDMTSRFFFMDDGMAFALDASGLVVTDLKSGKPVKPHFEALEPLSSGKVQQGAYKYVTEREIFEEPESARQTFECYANRSTHEVVLPKILESSPPTEILFTGCGAAYYAAELGAWWAEQYADLPSAAVLASELPLRPKRIHKDTTVVAVSQSGETKDLITALRTLPRELHQILSIVNVPHSRITQLSVPIYTKAFPEIGVTTTKAFNAQLTILHLLALWLAHKRGTLSSPDFNTAVEQLHESIRVAEEVLKDKEKRVRELGTFLAQHKKVFFLGRGDMFHVAEELALKLKEIAYLHAEAYPMAELKHGPLALVDSTLCGLFLLPSDALLTAGMTSVQEVLARGGNALLVTDAEGEKRLQSLGGDIPYLVFPKVPRAVVPHVWGPLLHLLCVYTADTLGRSIDKPRNLAKSVTVA